MRQPSHDRDQTSPLTRRPAGLRKRWRLFSVTVTLAIHLLVLLAFVGSTPRSARTFEPEGVTVNLVQLPPPLPADQPVPTPSPGARPKAATRPSKVAPPLRRPPPPAPTPSPLRTSMAPSTAPSPELTDAQLAGAITAGSGAGAGSGNGAGGGCDMVRRLQAALRRDGRVQAALREAGAASRALLIWNGDWIRSVSEDGKGLAGVRQAIIVEVGFAPEACRSRPMHGLVLISLNDAPGSARIALGAGAWRWSDLLFAR